MQDGINDPEAGDSHDNPLASPSAHRGQSLALAPPQSGGLDPLRASEQEKSSDEIDLLNYWRILVKRRWTVLSVLGIVFTAVLVSTLLTTPIYRATSTLQIDRDTIEVVQVKGMESAVGAGDRDFLQTQYELLRGRALAERVVSQLNLVDSPAFEKMMPRSPWGQLLSFFGGTDKAVDSEESVAAKRRAVVSAFRKGLTIEPVRNSRLVQIQYESPNPKFSTQVADIVAEAFIASNLEHRFDASSYAKSYLQEQLQQIKVKLEDSERKLVEFAQKEQIVGIGGEATLTEQNLGSINTAWAKAREERIGAEAKWRQAQAAHGTALPADVLGSSIIRTLQERRATAMADYQDKLRLYKPEYPLMLQLKGQIDEMSKQIADEVAGIKASIRAGYLAASEQESMLAHQLGGLKSDFMDLQNRSIQYNIYKREVDTNRQLYDGLLQRYKEIGVAGGVSTNNISLVDRADRGIKSKPKVLLALALAVFAGLLLGALLAIGFEYLDDTVKSPETLEKHLGLVVLGVIPKLKNMTPAVALEDPRSAFAESYRSVRTALQFSTATGAPRCLLITSATPSEGKSTTALTLARNFAQLGQRVLLIDADLRNPSQHRTLGLENGQGLSNVLTGASKPPDVIMPTQDRGLQVLTSGPLPPNPAELLAGSKMLSLLTVAGEKFDTIIIDGPPVLGLADAPILANVAHATLMVVAAGDTRIGVVRNAVKRLHAARAYVVGALLTKFESKHAGYGYSYGYGDYSYYSYGGKDAKKLAAG
jgi:capsular exopolysaccharide synthesis family protein